MNQARNQLILLGFVCQAFSWDDYLLPLAYVLLWIGCLSLPKGPVRPGPLTECALLVFGSAAGYFGAVALGLSSHFFIGHGVTLFQAARLMRPLTTREKVFSVLLACLQIGVGCTIVLDARFMVILLAMLYLIPLTLVELLHDSFPAYAGRPRHRPGFRAYTLIGTTALLFFLVFPRGFLGSGLQTHSLANRDQGSLLDSVLDPTQSGYAQSMRILLQVEGENLGYLRSFVLERFDGTRWHEDGRAAWRRLRRIPEEELGRYQPRRVRVKNVGYLGKVLPTDGRVVNIRGKFFRHPYRNRQGTIRCNLMWNTANNLYEYWIDPEPKVSPLSPTRQEVLTEHPPISPKLTAWLQELLDDDMTDMEKARRLENELKTAFTYQLGAPKLNRLNPLEDFLFEQKKGHCERFASSLALLLRMQDIPARVVIGYVPGTRSWFSGWYNVRFRDAHSWTEAYFPQLGWVQLDATPRATMDLSPWKLAEILEAMEFAWYLHVVNYDGASQTELFLASMQTLGTLGAWFGNNWLWLTTPPLLLGSFLVVYRFTWPFGWRPRRKTSARQGVIWAGHQYGQMLRYLARTGVHREPQQTPWEFFHHYQRQGSRFQEEVGLITRTFCETHYGHRSLTPERQSQMKEALRRLQTASKPS